MSYEKMKEAIDAGLTISIDIPDIEGGKTKFYVDKHSYALFMVDGKPLSVDIEYEDILEALKEFEEEEWEVVDVKLEGELEA